MFLFHLSTPVLVVLLMAVLGASLAAGVFVGNRWPKRAEPHREPLGVAQGALLGLIGLLLAFGLSMAVGRYDARRTLVVEEANAIGTTYLRAQLLDEPQRSASLDLLRDYTDEAIEFGDDVPTTAAFREASDRMDEYHNQLWALATEAMAADPDGSAPRLYVETLNEMIDAHSSRVSSLNNRVPTSVMLLLLIGSAIAIAVLSLYLTMLGKGVTTSAVTTLVLFVTLFISFDLDRPERGMITVPMTPLEDARESMNDG